MVEEVLPEEQRELYEELSIQQSICGGLENLEAFRRGLGIGIELMAEAVYREVSSRLPPFR